MFFSDRSGDFCRGSKHVRHIIDDGPVYAVERIVEDNFDGKGQVKCRVNIVGQKYGSYIYSKPCIIVGDTANQASEPMPISEAVGRIEWVNL